jgi:ketol-acid reductoisomerase
MGFEKKRLLKTTFADEAIGDIFGEQVVLCGGLALLIKNAFEVMIDDGLAPDKAYLEVAYQLDLIVNLIKRYGIEGMYRRISVTARYGSAQNGPKVIDQKVKKSMERILRDIKSGNFAARLSELTATDIKALNRTIKDLTHPDLEKAASKFSP